MAARARPSAASWQPDWPWRICEHAMQKAVHPTIMARCDRAAAEEVRRLPPAGLTWTRRMCAVPAGHLYCMAVATRQCVENREAWGSETAKVLVLISTEPVQRLGQP